MPRRRPPGAAGAAFSSTLIALLLVIPFVASAQQQHVSQRLHSNSPREETFPDTYDPQWPSARSEPGPDHRRNTPLISKNERAIATLAPAGSEFAVRAPPARSAAGPSGGLSSRPRARSLQDWEVEDFVLLATVDGKIYARDRNTGEERWTLFADRPMVDMTYHRQNESEDKGAQGVLEYEWIVEPNQDGNLYIATPAPNVGIQSLGLTVRQLAEELSPYLSEDPPVVYTAEKRSTLYSVDAATGRILKQFSSSGSSIIDEGSCRRVSGLEGLDDDECESIGTITLGRTEYTVGIANQATGSPICTIKYFEWAPNNRDKDLHLQYSTTMDNKYIYSKYDGTIFALDHTRDKKLYPQRPVYRRKFDSPVVRVYDVVRPFHANSKDTSLVLLPQPPGPASPEEMEQDVFVNCTENGSWYAMSEANYPTVTDGASKAQCYNADFNDLVLHWGYHDPAMKPLLVGVHSLSEHYERRSYIPTISGPGEVSKPEAPVDIETITNKTPPAASPQPRSQSWSVYVLMAMFALYVFAERSKALPKILQLLKTKSYQAELPPEARNIEVPEVAPEAVGTEKIEPAGERKVRFQVGEENISIPGEVNQTFAATDGANDPQVDVPSPERSAFPQQGEDGENAQETPKKKKAHRGQRGGRKRNKNRRTNGETDGDEVEIEGVQKIGKDQEVDFENAGMELSSAKQIHNLTITDKVLGSGSGGTFVFEGKFEGRDVAVKRMLPQYYELADQEVSLLTQSDDHPNVIRYFCKQKDENFLYIAVELCQASLWDLYKDGRVDEGWTDQQSKLVNEINCDIPRALYQLAAGLNHLHSLRIIHRDIKPQNILIAYPKRNQTSGPRFVISDFGLCKTLPDNMSTLVGTTTNAGTVGWKAPELILQPKEIEGRMSSNSRGDSQTSNDPVLQGVKRSVDIFSLGCVFYYVLTNGSHPFDDEEGWMQIRELNIKKNKFNFSMLEQLGDDAEEPIDLISRMVSNNPVMRPTALQIMQHPFFWNAEKRLTFLCLVSDRFECEPRDPASANLERLENHNVEVMCGRKGGVHKFPDFLAKLDRKFIDTLGKQRKYQGDRMLDLLRALRNKKNHYHDMPHDVQQKVGALPQGYLRYWTTRFPRLLMACYEAVQECGMEGEATFKPYFEASV